MGLLGEMYFSAEAYKIALEINENIKKIYRIMAPYGNIIVPANAKDVRPFVAATLEKLNEMEHKTNRCNPSRVGYIKVPFTDGSEIPVALYIAKMRNGLELMQSDLRESLNY